MIRAELKGGEELIARLEAMPDGIRSALRAELQAAALRLVGHVKQDKLSDQVLRVRTGRLRRSINQRVEAEESRIYAYIGTNVEYAAIHEYGFTGTVNVREHLRKSKLGREYAVRAHLRNVKLPERSFLRSALVDMKQGIRDGIVAAIAGAVKKG